MAIQLQIRRGTAAQWTTANPILADGEMGIETDTKKMKIGNAVDNWSTLTYWFDASANVYVHTQVSASTVWTINHNLGFIPSVEVLSVGNVEIEAEVVHTSVNQTIINFVQATAGSARLI